jgi:hypothetical protein
MVSLFFYVGADEGGEVAFAPNVDSNGVLRSITGRTESLGNFEVKFKDEGQKHFYAAINRYV